MLRLKPWLMPERYIFIKSHDFSCVFQLLKNLNRMKSFGLKVIALLFGVPTLVAICIVVGSIVAVEPKKYMGADACSECHQKEYDSWAKSKHAKAFDLLRDDKKSDLTCLWCHATDAKDNYKAFRLRGVQCEACHGRGAQYAYGTFMENFSEIHKKGLRKQDEAVCRDCHTPDRIPGIGAFNYKEKLEKIKHLQ